MVKGEFIENGYKLRGDIIGHMSIIETTISLIIAKNLSQETSILMYMLKKLNFDVKIKILENILNKRYSNFLNEYPEIIKDIRDMQEKRNLFAHSLNNIEDIKDYSELRVFNLHKIGNDIDKSLTQASYSLDEHDKNVIKLKWIMVVLEPLTR